MSERPVACSGGSTPAHRQSHLAGDSVVEKIFAHRDQPIPSIRAVRPEVPERVESGLQQDGAKNVQDRYQTMSEMLADLERLSAGRAQHSILQQLFGSTTDAGLADLLKDFSISPVPSRKSESWSGKNKKLLLIGSSILACWFLWRASSSVSRRKTARWSSK